MKFKEANLKKLIQFDEGDKVEDEDHDIRIVETEISSELIRRFFDVTRPVIKIKFNDDVSVSLNSTNQFLFLRKFKEISANDEAQIFNQIQKFLNDFSPFGKMNLVEMNWFHFIPSIHNSRKCFNDQEQFDNSCDVENEDFGLPLDDNI